MKCAYCGKKNKPGAVTCTRCGIALPPPPPPQGGEAVRAEGAAPDNAELEKKLDSTRKLSPALIAVLAAVAVIAVLIICLAGSGGLTLPGRGAYSAVEGTVFRDGLPVDLNGKTTVTAMVSPNGRTAGAISEDGTLFVFRAGAYTAVANNAQCFILSSDGKRMVYTDRSFLLWSYDCTKNGAAPVCISSEAVENDFAVSPNGKTVIFRKVRDGALYMIKGKKTKQMGEKLLPVSVTDNGRHIYAYSPSENALYYVNRKAKAAFVRGNIEETLFINSSHEEIVFSTDAGTGIVITMLCRRGGEPIEIMNGEGAVSPVAPVSAIVNARAVADHFAAEFPVKTFFGRIFAGSGVVKLGKKSAELLDPTPCERAVATNDYGTIYYLSDGDLYRRILRSKNAPTKVAVECDSFAVSENGSNLWYVKNSGELHYRRGTKDALIVRKVESFIIQPNGRTALFTRNGNVFLNKNGKPKFTYCGDRVKATLLFADQKGFCIFTEETGWTPLPELTERVDLTE